jgi:hypothetical protein
MSPEGPPTAEGDLQKTPLPHLLVYMADRRLTGSLWLQEPSGAEHVVRFEWGAPVHAVAPDGYAMFGELLVDSAIVSQKVVDHALAMKGLLGDVLILTGHADGETLERMASWQLERRMLRLFGLPAATSYRYFDGCAPVDTSPGSRVDLLRLLASGLRAYPRAGMPLGKLMERLHDLRLRVHAEAVLDRFCFTDEELRVVDVILTDQPGFVDLLSAEHADASVICRVVYVLLLTRHMDLGHRLPPLGLDEAPPGAAVGRMALRPALHRVGAAAPDPPGDGERAPVQRRTFRRRRPPTSAPGFEPSEPASDVRDLPAEDNEVSGLHEVSEMRNAPAGRAVSDVHRVPDAREPVSDVHEVADLCHAADEQGAAPRLGRG